MKIDLHNHSNYSDGIYSPYELLKIAKSKRIDCLALTDHDSVFGIEEAKKYAIEFNIKLISGIELSTKYNNESVHIIGLFKNDFIPNEIVEFSLKQKEIRKQRAIEMMKNIRDIYHLNIDLDLLLKSEIITRGNMLQNLLECNKEKTINELEFYVSHKSKAYIEVAYFNTKEGIEFLKRNNCVTIYAHPCLNKKETILEVIKFNVDAIEYKYPKNKKSDTRYFKKLARKNKLLLSAGSDFHGDLKHAMISTSTLEKRYYKKLIERLGI